MFNNKKDDDILEYMLFKDGTEKDSDSLVPDEEIDDEEEIEDNPELFGGLFSLLDEKKDDDDEVDEERIQELKNLGLTDDEVRLVIEEGYEPEDFEDDEDADHEDDDYYGEDD